MTRLADLSRAAQANQAKITKERVQFIRENKEKPIDELMQLTGLSRYVVNITIDAYENDFYREKHKGQTGRSGFCQKVEASDNLYTTRQVAQKVEYSESTLNNMFRAGEFPARKINNVWIVREKDLEEYLDRVD